MMRATLLLALCAATASALMVPPSFKNGPFTRAKAPSKLPNTDFLVKDFPPSGEAATNCSCDPELFIWMYFSGSSNAAGPSYGGNTSRWALGAMAAGGTEPCALLHFWQDDAEGVPADSCTLANGVATINSYAPVAHNNFIASLVDASKSQIKFNGAITTIMAFTQAPNSPFPVEAVGTATVRSSANGNKAASAAAVFDSPSNCTCNPEILIWMYISGGSNVLEPPSGAGYSRFAIGGVEELGGNSCMVIRPVVPDAPGIPNDSCTNGAITSYTTESDIAALYQTFTTAKTSVVFNGYFTAIQAFVLAPQTPF